MALSTPLPRRSSCLQSTFPGLTVRTIPTIHSGVPEITSATTRSCRTSSAYGALVLETIPASAELFVDGYYVGLAEEFGFQGRPLSLAAGPHRVELRAAGYETSSFNVMIDPDNILRYRGDMRLLSTGPAIIVLPQPAGPKTLYVIPKCYAGDKPPTGTLPPGCDRKNLQTYK